MHKTAGCWVLSIGELLIKTKKIICAKRWFESGDLLLVSPSGLRQFSIHACSEEIILPDSNGRRMI